MKTFSKWAVTTGVLLAALITVPLSGKSEPGGKEFGPSLTQAGTSARAVSPEGFIQRWLVLQPIPANGLTDGVVRAAVKKEYFPNQLTMLPSSGDVVNCNGTNLMWHALDTALYNVNLFHFARALTNRTSDALFWAVTVIESPEELSEVRLAIGSNAASVWWVNSEELISIFGDRQTVIDDGVSKRITLKKGPNVVRCAVINGGGATDFCARFLDRNDQPLTNLTVRLNATR